MWYVPLSLRLSLPPAYSTLAHRWLYDIPGILHRDLSPTNIMCRRKMEMNTRGEQEEKVYGVLTDYDLSSWKEKLKSGYTRTSQQRTGTPPYMAQELLQGASPTHLYRHDVESLFYIMLLLGARHTFGLDTDGNVQVVMREGLPPYQKWFDTQDYDTLGNNKSSFFLRSKPIELSPAFEDFRPWLEGLQGNFSQGFHKLSGHEIEQALRKRKPTGGSAGGVTSASASFDYETLGGHVDYSTIIESTRDLTGQLEGLVVRYDPTLPTPASTVQPDARAGS